MELAISKGMDEVEDGKVEVIGPDLHGIQPPGQLPMAIVAEVTGRKCRRTSSRSSSDRSTI